jgi:hypothetical protein
LCVFRAPYSLLIQALYPNLSVEQLINAVQNMIPGDTPRITIGVWCPDFGKRQTLPGSQLQQEERLQLFVIDKVLHLNTARKPIPSCSIYKDNYSGNSLQAKTMICSHLLHGIYIIFSGWVEDRGLRWLLT